MAVTLVSRPTTPNVTGTKLLFEVSGSDISHPQYSYVMDIYLSGSNEIIDRQFQRPNPEGVAEFNPAEVLAGNLSYDNLWKITGSAYPENAVKTFDLRFGEAYGTSISSSVTIYTGSSNNYLQVFPGVLNPNNVFNPLDISTYYNDGYNFYTASFNVNAPSSFDRSQFLTNFPAYNAEPGAVTRNYWIEDIGFLTKDDYATVTRFDEGGNPGQGITLNAGLTVGNSFSSVATVNITPDVNPAFPSRSFASFGIGAKNLALLSDPIRQGIESGSINTIYTSNVQGRVQYYIRDNIYNNYVNTFDIDPLGYPQPPDEDNTIVPLNREYLQFAFINELGFYDYYNVYSPLRRSSELSKNIVSLPKVDYSGTVSTYSYETGGDYDYHTEIKDQYSITTEWLGKTKANWLEEMLESPEVFVRQGDEYVPIVITNTTYAHNNSEARNKLFQYTINFRPSNGREIVQETYTDKTVQTTAWTSKWFNGLSAPFIAPELDRSGFGAYSPYWRVDTDVNYLFQSPPYTGYRENGPNDFIYLSGSVPFDTFIPISSSAACSDALVNIDIYGDDTLLFSTSSAFAVADGLQIGPYYYHFFPYTASFTEGYYENIVWSGSLIAYPYQTSSFDPTLGGTLSVNHWYDFTDQNSMCISGSEITELFDKGPLAPVNLMKTSDPRISSGPTFVDYRSGSYFTASMGLIASGGVDDTFVSENGITYVSIFEQSDPGATGSLQTVWTLKASDQTYLAEFYPLMLHNSGSAPFFAGGSAVNYNDNNNPSPIDSPQSAYIWNYGGITNPLVEMVASAYTGVQSGQEHMFAGIHFTTGSLSGGTYINSFSSSLDGLPFGGERFFRSLMTGQQGDMGVGYAAFTGPFVNPRNFDGYLKHLLVYSGSLSDTQISSLYNHWTGSYS